MQAPNYNLGPSVPMKFIQTHFHKENAISWQSIAMFSLMCELEHEFCKKNIY